MPGEYFHCDLRLSEDHNSQRKQGGGGGKWGGSVGTGGAASVRMQLSRFQTPLLEYQSERRLASGIQLGTTLAVYCHASPDHDQGNLPRQPRVTIQLFYP